MIQKIKLLNLKIFVAFFVVFAIGILLSTPSFSKVTLKYACTNDACMDGTAPQPQPYVTCCVEGVEGGPGAVCLQLCVQQCDAVGGAIQDCIPHETRDTPPGATSPQDLKPTNTTANQGFINNLTNAITNASVHSNRYNATIYDCDDFANDLERNLTARGYDATYTYLIHYNADNTTKSSHAVTDVHVPDGSILFIEPQTGKIINLDIDGDGKVEARVSPNPYKHGYLPTDDNAKITIYPDRASAETAGAPAD
ncbi:MAG TPA: hypothetical protein VJJ23_02285 [Candidatus Nanoarchaeia archaeon]|nr:hypothetical protein [Candidatus Nanoarchaeia archaeon]